MKIGTLIGFLLALGVFLGSVFMTFDNPEVMLNFNGILIVLGGTFAVGLICFPIERIFPLLLIFLKRVLGRKKIDFSDIIREIVFLANQYQNSRKAFEEGIGKIQNLFLKDCGEMLLWMRGEVHEDELRRLLEIRAATHYTEYSREAKIFKILSRFPPAFGLMGTTIGMMALLQSIGVDEESKARIGPSMAIALVTTLYGLFLANFIFTPISENLQDQTLEDERSRLLVIEGIIQIYAGKPPRYVEEYVKSFLLPKERRKSPA